MQTRWGILFHCALTPEFDKAQPSEVLFTVPCLNRVCVTVAQFGPVLPKLCLLLCAWCDLLVA